MMFLVVAAAAADDDIIECTGYDVQVLQVERVFQINKSRRCR
jgi:hypothetical protein